MQLTFLQKKKQEVTDKLVLTSVKNKSHSLMKPSGQLMWSHNYYKYKI